VIVQRMKGNVDVLAAIVEKVKRENAKENAAVIRNESGKEKDKMLPILHCAEIIDNPFVRAEIQKAVIGLGPSYRQ
jgi:predicted nuclease with TOPRIM domain